MYRVQELSSYAKRGRGGDSNEVGESTGKGRGDRSFGKAMDAAMRANYRILDS